MSAELVKVWEALSMLTEVNYLQNDMIKNLADALVQLGDSLFWLQLTVVVILIWSIMGFFVFLHICKRLGRLEDRFIKLKKEMKRGKKK